MTDLPVVRVLPGDVGADYRLPTSSGSLVTVRQVLLIIVILIPSWFQRRLVWLTWLPAGLHWPRPMASQAGGAGGWGLGAGGWGLEVGGCGLRASGCGLVAV